MAVSSTSIVLSTAKKVVLSSATTWADTLDAHVDHCLDLYVSNWSSNIIAFIGSSSITTGAPGIFVPPQQTVHIPIHHPNDQVWGLTTGMGAFIGVTINGQRR